MKIGNTFALTPGVAPRLTLALTLALALTLIGATLTMIAQAAAGPCSSAQAERPM